MRRFTRLLCFAFLGTVLTLLAEKLPFDFQSTLIEETENHRTFHVTFPSPEAPFWEQAKQVKAFYYEPKPLPPDAAPAVLCLHILGGNGQLTQSIAAYFADHGLPALMPQMPLFLERRPNGKMTDLLNGKDGPRYLTAAFKAVPGDIKRSVDFLASRPGVDATRLNVMGTSLGGILAVSTLANDKRLDKGIFLLAGGGLKEILEGDKKETKPIAAAMKNANAEQAKELERLCAYLEPMNYVEALSTKAKNGSIRLYNAQLDTLITPERSNALAKGLGLEPGKGHFILPNVNHYTAIVNLPKLLDEALVFFGGQAKTIEGNDYTKVLFKSIAHWLNAPEADRTSRLVLNFNFSENGNVRHSGKLQLNIQENRFNLALNYPKGLEGVRDIRFGYDGAPWLISSNGTVFKGEKPVAMDTGALLPQQFHFYRQMASTFLAHLAETGSTDTLSKLLKAECNWEGRKFIAKNQQAQVEIQLDEKRDVPTSLRFSYGNMVLDIKASTWECGAMPLANDFTPPEGKPIREVDGEKLSQALLQVASFA
ncbi:MAG: dienelactone hydrolase family protein, partial [Victivallales bacterium]|nr:dienelactone hydrolase family protein [Victivallales bacterium]